MADSEYIQELEKNLKILETRVKHLTNDLALTRQDYEESMARYFDIYSNMEKKVQERADKLQELQSILKIKNLQLEIIFDSSPALIFYKDINERYVRVNKKFAEMFGISISSVSGKTHAELFPKDTDSILASDREVLGKKEPNINQSAFIHTPGGLRRMLISKIPYKDIDGHIIGIIGLAIDMTEVYNSELEKNELKEKLSRAEKMEAIGLLAGGVAHDLNNILTGIVSYPDLLLLEIPEDSPLRRPIITIQESGLRAAAIVQDLLTLARRGVVRSETTNLNILVQDYLKSLEYDKLHMYHPQVDIVTELEQQLLNIRCSPVHITKTIMNLVVNAAEAIAGKGKIILSTRNCYIDNPFKRFEVVNEGDYAVLEVTDSGSGIAEEDMKRIFEPFYTKKVMGKSGTGLGMAVVWGVVKDHKGFIDIETKTGQGTTFTLYFPVTRQEIIADGEKLAMQEYMGKGEMILVVDDIAEQREIAQRMLEKLNYRVMTAASGEEAVAIVRMQKVDLVVLDMIMSPGMDGLDTFRQIVTMYPGQKAIITSGFAETDRVKETQRLGAGIYLKKPYLFENFGVAVKDELKKVTW
ncbi:MAG TPA: ATP-binding protein [bacterium]|nr:ATP-binding protein [bacterium]HPN43851.1 ATP-binding protein [bacterium]